MEEEDCRVGARDAPKAPLRVHVVSEPKSWAERSSAWVPLFISGLALGTSIWSAEQARVHNRLSVKPFAYFMSERVSSKQYVGISLNNSGAGPAMIKQLRIYLDGQQATYQQVESASGGLFKGTTLSWNTEPAVLRTGEKYFLLYTESSNVADFAAFAKFILERLYVVAQSCSVYEECTKICTLYEDEQCDAIEKQVAAPRRSTP